MIDSAFLLWVVGVLAGSMLFFGVVVAPLVFRVLPADAAGSFLRAFFPSYYLWGLVVMIAAAVLAAFVDPVSLILCVLVAVLFAYTRQSLMPKINEARDASLAGNAEASIRFERLHRLSVIINAMQLLVLLAIAGMQIW